MHFAEVDGLVTTALKIFDPAVLPGVGIFQNTSGVWIVTSEETCPGWGTGRSSNEAVVEHDALVMQAIKVGGVHEVIASSGNRVKTLLVSYDKNDVWAVIRHSFMVVRQ